jgi:hypothetical protein
MDFTQVSSIEYAGTICFVLAILHTFSVKFFQIQARRFAQGSIGENFFHFLGEVEVVFGIWAALFILSYALLDTSHSAVQYLEGRSFTEPLLVFVLMTICATKPILNCATYIIDSLARLLPLNKNLAFYISTLVVGPILGSFITEPAAMTVTALILLDRFYNQGISQKLRYATLGLLFVNISIGGTLTSFAAPPVLMVAAKWNWDMTYMLTHFGWKAFIAMIISTSIVAIQFNKEISSLILPTKMRVNKSESMPIWITGLHLLFLFLIVLNHHHSVVFISFFLFFLGLSAVTEEYQKPLQLKGPLLVAFFLGGLVVLGGMQSWWLGPVLSKLGALSLYLGAATLTAVTDNAAITYLGSQVEGLTEISKYALVAGSVVGGGLTVIANAPNPAGYSILNPTFGTSGISALSLFKSALIPTLISIFIFWWL